MDHATTLTGRDVADILGVSPATVTRLANTGALAYRMHSGRKVYDRCAVDDYLVAANLRPAPSDHPAAAGPRPDVTALSFFSGAGGLDIGMERAGITTLLASEVNRECRMTLDANRPGVGLLGDISALDAETVRRYAGLGGETVDVIHGGPPCQAFSTAGAGRGFYDARGNVFLQFIDLAVELAPTYLVIENVRGLLSAPYPVGGGDEPVRGGALSTVLGRLRAAGYGVSFNLYNAANYGAPQIRERVILIAKSGGGKVPWLRPTHSEGGRHGLAPWRTFGDVADALAGVEHHHGQFSSRRLGYFSHLTEGQCWRHLPPDLQREAMGKAYGAVGGRTGFYRRIRRDRPSPTLVTCPTMPATDLCHPTEDRPLSVEEYREIQGFPREWWIAGSVDAAYRQLGNAVPVPLGEAVGRAILDDMAGKAVAAPAGFAYSRYKNTDDVTWPDPARA